MDEFFDFSNCSLGWRDYGGSDKKESIIYNGHNYMLKFPSQLERRNDLMTSYANNVISEYVGSHIVASTGLPVHKTMLGMYNDSLCVACEDFVEPGYSLHEFSWYMRSFYNTNQIGRIPTYNQLYDVMENNRHLSSITDEAIERYWDTFVVDALIGNFDRHKGNWGYLVNESMGTISLAPIYDCGSCLYSELAESQMENIINDAEEIDKRIYLYPKAALNKNDNPKKIDKFGYYEMLSSGMDSNCTKALIRVGSTIDIDKICDVVDNTPYISNIRKNFYKVMLVERKEKIIDAAIEKIVEKGLGNNEIFNDYYER